MFSQSQHHQPPWPQEQWGLAAENGNIADYPLIYANCDYQLTDVHMSAILAHTYQCVSSSASDVTYSFPLPANASVHEFKAVIDQEHIIVGVVKEKAEAKAEYQKAVSRGKNAALLQQENVEIFKMMLGNVKPFQTIEVHIAFVATVAHNGSLDSLRLTFPTAIAPRYGAPPGGVPMHGISKRSGLDFSVAVEMTSQITSIASPSQHPIVWQFGYSSPTPAEEWNAHKARVSLSSTVFLDKDIVLVLSCLGLDKPRCVIESFSPEEGAQEYTDAYALTFVPRFNLPALPRQEFIFLVDRSGSMDGAKMTAVQSSLQIMLRSLPSKGSSFNIISFGSFQNTLWPRSVPYTADAVKEASAHVDSMTANFGGTEMKNALATAFSSRAIQGAVDTPTSVFVLTDGQSHDLDGVRASISQAISMTKTQAKTEKMFLRIFCMGIGDAVSKAMCEAIARAGNGASVFVGETEKPDQKLMGLLRAASGPPVENLTIDWGVNETDGSSKSDGDDDDEEYEIISESDITLNEGVDAPMSFFDDNALAAPEAGPIGPTEDALPPVPMIQQAPMGQILPPVYPGFRADFFAIVRRTTGGNSAPSRSVRISGTVLGAPVQLDIPVTTVSRLPASNLLMPVKMIHLLAARALIQTFEEMSPVTHTHKAQIHRLALRYGLASSQTSFVAIDQISQTEVADYSDYLYGQSVHPHLMPYQAKKPMIQMQQQQQQQQKQQPQSAFHAQSPIIHGYAPPSPLQFPPARLTTDSHPSIQRYLAEPEVASPTTTHLPAYSAPFGGMMNSYNTKSALGISPSGTFGTPDSAIGSMGMSPGFGMNSGGGGMGMGAPSGGLPPLLSFAKRGVSKKQAASVPQPSPPAVLPHRSSTTPTMSPSSPGTPGRMAARRAGSLGMPSPASPLSPITTTQGCAVEALAREQAFDGSFAVSQRLLLLTTKQDRPPKMPTTLDALALAADVKAAVWCTLICVAFLHTKLAAERDVWGIIGDKALEWVKETLGGVDFGEGESVEVLVEEWKQAGIKFVR